MKKIVNSFFLGGYNFMLTLHLRKAGFMYSAFWNGMIIFL